MAGPNELDGQARRRSSMRPRSDTLDENVQRAGSPSSRPALPRYDSDARMSGSARPHDMDGADRSAVPQTVDQSTGGVKPKATCRQYRRTR